MSSSSHYSDVSAAFNSHIANLDKARRVFEEEVEVLNSFVFKHLEDRRTWPVEGVRKTRWGRPEPWSSTREVAWLNWSAATRTRMDIRAPGYKRFRKAAAYVFFQVAYDSSLGTFAFTCRVENQNSVDAALDERAIELIQTMDPGDFPNSVHVKRNTAMLFRCELEESLWDEANNWVDRGLDILTKVVDQVFPDELYRAHIESDAPETDNLD